MLNREFENLKNDSLIYSHPIRINNLDLLHFLSHHINQYKLTGQKITGKKNSWVLIPVAGVILFIFTYIIATLLYPGGSQADMASKGFSWIHNYWCNLLNEKAINGEYNPAKPVAIAGMFILSFSLALFWYQFAELVKFQRNSKKIIQFSGIISMCAGLLIFTSYHDIIINIAGFLAIFALAGTFSGLDKMRWHKLSWFGFLNVVLIGINNYIYYTTETLHYLPVIQKITFLSFLLWISIIDIGLYRLSDRKPAGNIKISAAGSLLE